MPEQYEDFEQLTRKSLLHTLAVEMKADGVDSLMQAYDGLSTFPDVVPALEMLEKVSDLECVVFSNGTPKMIENSVNRSLDLRSVSTAFSRLISVDHMRRFKPHPEVYRYLAQCVEMPGQESQIWLISSEFLLRQQCRPDH